MDYDCVSVIKIHRGFFPFGIHITFGHPEFTDAPIVTLTNY